MAFAGVAAVGCSDIMRCMKGRWFLFVATVAWAQQFDAASVKAVQLENLAPSRITADPVD